MIRVFLGGTCNNSAWRDKLIPMLRCDYFNPVVEDCTHECQAEEIRQRNECDYVLYVITPRMTGIYSLAEVIDDSNKRPKRTIFLVLPEDDGAVLTNHQVKSLMAVGELVHDNGGYVASSLESVAAYLNLPKPGS